MLNKIVLSSIITSSLFADINVISNRSDFHILPLTEKFTKETGIKVNTVFVDKGIIERVNNGGMDIIISKDILILEQLSKKLQAPYEITSYRTRGFFVKKGTKIPNTYSDLLKPEYKGKICIRPLTDNYNIDLFTTMLTTLGADKTSTFINGLKSNLAVTPTGNDRGQVKNIYDGICDVAIGNSYYMNLMQSDPNQKPWADTVNFIIPKDGIKLYSGIGKLTNNPENDKFIKFMNSKESKYFISKVTFENTTNLKTNYNFKNMLDSRKKIYDMIKN